MCNFGLISLNALGVLLMFFINRTCDGLGAEKAESFNGILDLNLRTFFHK